MIQEGVVAYIVAGTAFYLRVLTYPELGMRMREWHDRSLTIFVLALINFTISMVLFWPYWVWRAVRGARKA